MTDRTVSGPIDVSPPPPPPGTAKWAPRKLKRTAKVKGLATSMIGTIVGAVVSGSLVIILATSHAALIFGPKDPELFSIGIQMALMSTVILSVFIAIFSSIKGATAFSQDVTAVSISVMVVAMLAVMPSGVKGPAELSTLLASICIVTFAAGLFFYVLGRLRLGRLIRFTPIPVIGGFLAATGWLIAKGALTITLSQTITIDNLFTLLSGTGGLQVASAAAIALATIIAVWRSANPVAVPLLVLIAVILFHVTAMSMGLSYDELRQTGWLAATSAGEGARPIFTYINLAAVDWQLVLQQFPLMLTVLTVGTIALLMNASSLELSLSCDIDLDRELRATGGANIVSSIVGGIPGYIGLSPTVLNHRLGGKSRLCGLIIAGMAFAILFLKADLMAWIPLPVLGGLLLWLGSTLLYDWLYSAWHRVSWAEYLVMVAILLVVVLVGMLEGVFTGLIAGIILFVIDYSRIDVVKTQLTARHFNSRREMPEVWREHLRQHGGSIVILKLQGFIFFGTAHQLVERIYKRIEREDQAQIKFLVMDFRHTSGIDSSAVLSFLKLERIAAERKFKVVLTNLDDSIQATLSRGGFADSETTPVRVFDDLDHGLQWCEDKLIYRVAPNIAEVSRVPIQQKLISADVNEPTIKKMLAYMDRLDVEKADHLIEQGSSSNDMYFIESGRFAVVIDNGDGNLLKISTLLPGAVAGEMAFYANRPRSASVVCEEPGIVWRFSRENLKRMQMKEPGIAYHLHERMAVILAERLGGTTRLVQHLAD